MTSIGTWARTVASLSPNQVFGRPLFRARRALLPPLLRHRAGSIPVRAAPLQIFHHAPAPTVLLPDAIQLLGSGVLELVGQRGSWSPTSFVPRHSDPLYCYAFHQLDWAVAATQRNPNSYIQRQIATWLDGYLRHPHELNSVFWDPYPVATRILMLPILMARGLVDTDLGTRRIVEWTQVLSGMQEKHLQGNHLLRGRAAAALGSSFIGGSNANSRRANAWKLLAQEAAQQFFPDGMHEERTPSYHLLCTLDLLLALGSVDRSAPQCRAQSQLVSAVAGRALGAAEPVSHRDGRTAAFGDTAPESIPSAADIGSFALQLNVSAERQFERNVSGRCTRATLSESGYSRIASDRLDVFVSHGPFGAPRQPGHAHCDLLSLEIDVDGSRLIVDPGVHSYHDVSWRNLTRATAEHCTINVGCEQAELWGRFRVGWRPRVTQSTWTRFDEGWVGRFAAVAFGPRRPTHFRRSLIVCSTRVSVDDETDGSSFTVMLTLAPGLELRVLSKNSFQFFRAGLALAKLTLSSGDCTESQTFVSHKFGERVPAAGLELASSGNSLRWSIEAST